MKKTILLYSIAMAAAAFLLQWLEYKYALRLFSTEIYIAIIAILFTALGAWVGHQLTRRRPPLPFEKNHAVIKQLSISERECQVLELLAEGHTNQQIAERLFVSANTVKTHLAHLYQKLSVSRRTQAVNKARELRVIP